MGRANDNLRKLVLNATVWIAQVDVPPNGVADQRPTLADLQANLDEPQPRKLNAEKTFDQLHLKLSSPQ